MHEKVQKRNPHSLTIRQHIFPSFLIKNFCDKDGEVEYFDLNTSKTKKVTPKDIAFCTKRVWDQRAESGYMKSIEDNFLKITKQVQLKKNYSLSKKQQIEITEMFLLWQFRQQFRDRYPPAVVLNGVKTDNTNRTKNEMEKLESMHVTALDKDGKIPARNMIGDTIQLHIIASKKGYTEKWGIIRAHEGEFLVPDSTNYKIIPIDPKTCLVYGEKRKRLSLEAVKTINQYLSLSAKEYYFAHDLSNCPII